MAARTFTSAGANNLWSNAANWDGGLTIPAEDDSVTIPAGQTCEYDYNSAYTTGINGITITGTLSLSRATGTYRLFMKAATAIGGAGTFDCGTAVSIIPFAAKHLVTGGAAWYINGAAGLTMTVYAAEPVIKTVLLSGAEAIGQTELSVDTDVTGDIWADGDTVRIDDINKAQESEERVIAAGGIAAGTITVTAGLTAAKSTGAVVSLITRNVKFIGVGAAGYVAQNFASGKLTIAGGQWTTANYRAFNSCTGMVISGGTFTGCNQTFATCYDCTVSGGVFSGNSSVFYFCTRTIVTGGLFSGNANALNSCSGSTISGGVFSGNNNGLVSSAGVSISGGVFSGNNYAIGSSTVVISGGTFSGNNSGVNGSFASIKNATFSNNTQDIAACIILAFNTLFGSVTENTYTSVAKEAYSESYDHDQVAGAYKAWTKGGVTSSQASVLPTGYTHGYATVLENATVEGYWQREVTVGAGASVNITMNLRKAASMTYLPRCIIFNKAETDPFAGGAGLNTFTMTDSVDTWEDDIYTYTNETAEDVTLVIRFLGMAASGTVYSALLIEQINVDLTSALAKLTAIQAKTDNLPTDPADESLLEAAIAAITVDNAAIAAAVMASVVEGTLTLGQAQRLFLAALAGKASGGGTTEVTFRDTADSKDRIVATVDANGNRTAVTLDVT